MNSTKTQDIYISVSHTNKLKESADRESCSLIN